MQNTTATIPAALHKCKYCGAITTLSDSLCIKAPQPTKEPTPHELMKEVCGLLKDEFDYVKPF